MKTYKITLNEREMDALQISLMACVIGLEKEIEELEKHNKTTANTCKINAKYDRIKECTDLWHKLYYAELTQ